MVVPIDYPNLWTLYIQEPPKYVAIKKSWPSKKSSKKNSVETNEDGTPESVPQSGGSRRKKQTNKKPLS